MSVDELWFDSRELTDEGLYEARCPKGHDVRIVLQNARHEVLFDAAALALVDGYHREAIATFATALERALEFFTRVTAWQLAGGATAPAETAEAFAAAWKLVPRSERQFGMFVMAHYALTREAPPFTNREYEDKSKIRDHIVHAGRIYDEATALEYGEFVYNTINKLHATLRTHAADAQSREIARQISQAREAVSGSVTTHFQATLVSTVTTDSPRRFTEALRDFAGFNMWVDWHERVSLSQLARETGRSPRELIEHLESTFGFAAREAEPEGNDG